MQIMNSHFVTIPTRRFPLAFSLFVFIACAATTAFAGDRIVTGQYEVTSTRAGKTTTSSYCTTPEIAKGTNGNAQEVRSYLENSVKTCKISAFDLAGDTINYTMTCNGMTTTIHVVYHGDHFEGDMTNYHGGQASVAHTTAKRSGACKAEGQ
jgi:hypothetical protein